MTELNQFRKPERGPIRRIARALLSIIGVIAVIAVPVWAWQNFAPRDVRGGGGEPASKVISIPSLAGIQDSLLGVYLRFEGADAQAPVSDEPTPVTFTVFPGETATQISVASGECGTDPRR